MNNSRILTIDLEEIIVSKTIKLYFNLNRQRGGYQLASVFLITQKDIQKNPIKLSQNLSFFDMKFNVRGVKFPCHKIMLSIKSHYYDTEKLKNINEIDLDLEPEDFLKNYIYIIYGIGKLCDSYTVFKICQLLHINNSFTTFPDPTLSNLKLCYKFLNDSTVTSKMYYNFIIYNISLIIKEKEFLLMLESVLISILKDDNLFIEEDIMWEACLEWGKAQLKENEKLSDTLKNIIPHVRFELIKNIKNLEVISDTNQIKKSTKERNKIFPGSQILTRDEQVKLYGLIGKAPSKMLFKLQDTIHPYFEVKKLDSEDQLLYIIQTKPNYIFGAYVNQIFKKKVMDDKSYVFSLINPTNSPQKMNCIRNSNSNNDYSFIDMGIIRNFI